MSNNNTDTDTYTYIDTDTGNTQNNINSYYRLRKKENSEYRYAAKKEI